MGTERSYKALACKVIAVASVNTDVGDWAVYVDAVPGIKHSDEWEAVARVGDKVSEGVAAALWPDLAEKYTYRS